MILYDGTLLCKRTYCQDDSVFLYSERYIQVKFIYSSKSKILTEYFRNARLQKWFLLKSMHMPSVINNLNQFIWQNVFWRRKKHV